MQKQTGYRIPTWLDDEIKAYADYRGQTKNAVVIEALWDYLEKQKEKGTHNENT